jgi:tryptophan synthase alpha subunit
MQYMQQEMEMIRLMAQDTDHTRLKQMAEAELSFMEQLKSTSKN